ncbi:MAG: WbqC family protein [Cyclobacteriaceae bacterium]|nr:WbqC family protein [Cyclobacteriaceae bacterium]
MDKTVIIEMHYLPSLAWFAQISRFQIVHIDPSDRYRRQTYRNRCRIRGANKVENLIVPVIGGSQDFTADVYIDYRQKWVNNHRRAISSAYGKAPFFEYFSDDILNVYDEQYEKLIDLNTAMLQQCMKILGIKKPLLAETVPSNTSAGMLDLRNAIEPKNNALLYKLYNPNPYFQVFGNAFEENLSIIDLLFCEGPAAIGIVKKSAVESDNFDK